MKKSINGLVKSMETNKNLFYLLPCLSDDLD